MCVPRDENRYFPPSVVTVFNHMICGQVPRELTDVFIRFLKSQGTIHAEVKGDVVDRGYGLEVPVVYVFGGLSLDIGRLSEALYNDVWPRENRQLPPPPPIKEESTQTPPEHVLSPIPSNARNRHPQKACVVCRKYGTVHRTRYLCSICNVNLCKGRCFDEYHSV